MSESFAAAMADAARTIRVGQDLDCVLNDIVRAAVASLPGIDHAGVTIIQRSREYVTRASTDPLVVQLDALQYTLGEGPCVYAMEAEQLVVVNNLRREQRWPEYIPRAAQLGLRAQMGLLLVLDEHKIGVLNLYSTEADEIDPDVAHGAELFAAHAALALGFARRNEDLNTALGTRKLIGQAIGLVMAEFTVTEDQAFAYLRRVSSVTNIKLRDVAANIVDLANDKAIHVYVQTNGQRPAGSAPHSVQVSVTVSRSAGLHDGGDGPVAGGPLVHGPADASPSRSGWVLGRRDG